MRFNGYLYGHLVEFVETGGESDEAIWNFASYALAKNPATRIGLSWPWKDFPQNYASAEEHRDGTDESYALWVNLANDLNADYPDADVFTINHAEVVYDLRAAYEAGELGVMWRNSRDLFGPNVEIPYSSTRKATLETLQRTQER